MEQDLGHRGLHGCHAECVESVPVAETFRGNVAWHGEVQVLRLVGCGAAEICYPWSHAAEGATDPRIVTVRHQGPVDSPSQGGESSDCRRASVTA